jgi:putative DNA primase/helicase
MILSGINQFVRNSDLADRGVFLNLPPITDDRRRLESVFWPEFRALQPKILGRLLDAMVGAARELPSVRLTHLPRMADFARLGEAVGRGLGWGEGAFLSAYLANRKDATAASLEDSPLAEILLSSVKNGGMVRAVTP